jgi:hypothetical protein
MRAIAWLVVMAAGCLAPGCSRPEAPAPKAAEPVRITQLYTSASNIAKGEKALLCYGVENAKTVWLEPPRQELSAALSRCVEVTPDATTTYTLTAEGADGKSASKSLTVPVGPRLAKIVNVNVTSLTVKPGEPVEICYTVEGARSVTIEPVHFTGGSKPKGCVTDQPRKETTYVVTAIGSGGDKDQEKVTVKVQ